MQTACAPVDVEVDVGFRRSLWSAYREALAKIGVRVHEGPHQTSECCLDLRHTLFGAAGETDVRQLTR